MNKLHSQEWFCRLFDRYYDQVRNYLYYLSGDVQWVDDAIQDVFMVVWENRNSINDETVLPFLLKIGRNFFIKKNRRQSVRLKFEKRQDAGVSEMSAEEAIVAYEFDVGLQAAISELPERCRTIFLMSKIDELSNREIAENLNVSVKAVEKQITKAYKLLRTKLAKE